MKKIKAFVKPESVPNVMEAPNDGGFKDATLFQREGKGTYDAKVVSSFLNSSGTDSQVYKLEPVLKNEVTRWAINIIPEPRETPNIADGILCLSDFEDAFGLKTKESLKRYEL